MESRRKSVAKALTLAALSVFTGSVFAQRAMDAYPARPVKMMVGYPPGGLPDTTARLIAQRLSESTGQQFIIENKPGASGALACELVARSAPDGHTLLIADIGQAAINMALYPKLAYDTLRDFAPISTLGTSRFFLAVHVSAGVSTFQELVALARAKPGHVTYGSSGNGSPAHLATEMLKSIAGLDLLHVPFKGGGQSLPALAGGQVHLLFTVLPTVAGVVKAGSVKLLGVASETRSIQTPDVPTFAEMGIKGMVILPSVSVLAPVATPKPVIGVLAVEIAKAVHHPETLKRFASMGIEAVGNSPEAYGANLKDEIAFYARAVKLSGATID